MIRPLHASRLEQAWTRSVFETLFPTCAGVDLERFLREHLAAMPAASGLGLRAAVAVVTVSPVFLLRRPALFSHLIATDRLRVLDAFATSDVYVFRSFFTLLKAIGAMACAADARKGGR